MWTLTNANLHIHMVDDLSLLLTGNNVVTFRHFADAFFFVSLGSVLKRSGQVWNVPH